MVRADHADGRQEQERGQQVVGRHGDRARQDERDGGEHRGGEERPVVAQEERAEVED